MRRVTWYLFATSSVEGGACLSIEDTGIENSADRGPDATYEREDWTDSRDAPRQVRYERMKCSFCLKAQFRCWQRLLP